MYSVLIYDPKSEVSINLPTQLRFSIAKSKSELIDFLCKKEWDTIITFGEKQWDGLTKQPHYIRRKWVHLETLPEGDALVTVVQNVYYSYTVPDSEVLPLVSIYTPTYNSRDFILQTAASVQLQTWDNWEWIIIDDGSSDDTVGLLESLKDPRIRIFKFPNTGRIGYLKGAATSLAKGKYVVELDHDDFLTADALDKIQKAFEENTEVGMVYSNCAEWWQNTDRCNVYDAPYWNYRDTQWNGITLKEALSHDAMGTCDFGNGPEPVINHMPVCPNHVRAFRASTLKEVGGYRNLVWADDYDLMVRMFLHSRIHHINELLYVQRFGTNTWTKNSNILWPCFGEIHKIYRSRLEKRILELGL